MSYGGIDFNQSILKQASTLRRTGKLPVGAASTQNDPPSQTRPSPTVPPVGMDSSPQVKPKPKPAVKTADKSSPASPGARLPTRPPIDSPGSGRPKGNSVLELSKKLMQAESTSGGSNSSQQPPVTSAPTATSPSKKQPPAPPTRKDSTKLTRIRQQTPPPSADAGELEELYDDIQEYSSRIQAAMKAKAAAPPSQPPPNLLQQQQQQQPPPSPSPSSSVTESNPPPLPPPNNQLSTAPYGVQKSPSFEAERKIERPNSTYQSSTLPGTAKGGKQIKKPSVFATTNYKELEEPMGLADFVNRYQNRFPTQMKMCSPHNNGAVTVNSGDIYNVHFLKNTDVVSLTASGGTQYFVPLNSAIEFGLVYNPTNNVQDALQGFVFATAGEIMSTGTMPPPIICVQQNCEVSSQEGSVLAGDVLVVNEVKSKLLRGKLLLCTDVRTEQKKRLPDTCTGDFSTTPSQVKLFLPQVLRHIPLPQYCVLSYSGYGNDAQNIAAKLPRGIVELTRTTTQQSLIVSKEYSDELMEFPITNTVTVQPIQPSEAVAQNLIADTNYKYDSFKPASVRSMSLMLSMENPYTISKQVALLSVPRSDQNGFIGVKLIKPGSDPVGSNGIYGPATPLYGSPPPLPPANEPQPPATPPPVPPAPSSSVTNQNDEDDDDYQLPCLALEEYRKTMNSSTGSSKSSANIPIQRQGQPVGTSSSHYDTPRSQTGGAGPKGSMVVSTPPVLDEGDEDIYDIPCPNSTPPLAVNTKPVKINEPSSKKLSKDHGSSSKPALPPITSIPSNPPIYGAAASTASQPPAKQQDTVQLQTEVNRLKEETKTLKATVERLESMFNGMTSTIGEYATDIVHF